MTFSKKHNTITKENINEMVITFYTKILKEDGGWRVLILAELKVS